MDRKNYITHSLFFLVLLITFLVAWPALSGPLIFDDFTSLGPLLVTEIDSYNKIIFGNHSGVFGRSVSMASFAFNHWLSGELLSFDLKLSNIIIHLVNGLILYAILLILLKRYYIKSYATMALAVTALWLLNPVNLGTVFYVIQRMALLSCFFVLLGCFLYLKARLTETTGRRYGLYFLVFVCWGLAGFSKENGLLLPLFLLLIELCYFTKLIQKINKLNLKQISALSTFLIVFGLSIIFILTEFQWLDYSSREFTLSERLYTQPVAILDYVRHTFLPTRVISGVFFDDFFIKDSFWNFATLLSLLLIILMLMGSYLILSRGRLSQYRLIAFGLLFFLVAHSMESSIFPLEIYFLHRNYLPSVGACLVVVLVIWHLLETKVLYRIREILVAIYFVFLSFHSWQTAEIWSSSIKMTVNAFTQQPSSVRANLSMTQLLVDNGRYKESLQVNDQLLKLRPKMALRSFIQRFYIYCELGKSIPTEEYTSLSNHIYFQNYLELSTALANFLESYQKQQCTFIDLKRIALTLAVEVDSLIASERSNASLLWAVEYYIVEFFRVAGEESKAIKRLQKSYEGGNNKALIMMEEFNYLI